MSLYEDLGVGRDATPDEIKKAYRSRAQKSHPDREGGDAEVFHAVQTAHDVLSDPDRRERYDRTGHTGAVDPVDAKLTELFQAIINDGRFDGDIVSHGRKMCQAAIATIDAKTKGHDRDLMKLTKHLNRLTSNGKRNVYRDLMQDRIEVLEGVMRADAIERAVIEQVMERLADYQDHAPPTTVFYTS